jgi:hypothetical protein
MKYTSDKLKQLCSKEYLEQIYLVENKSMDEVADKLGITRFQLRLLLTFYSIKKDRKKVAEVTERKTLEKYGVKSTNQLSFVQRKKEQTNLRKYGVKNVMQTVENRQLAGIRLNTPDMVQRRSISLQSRTEEQKQEGRKKCVQTWVNKYGKDYEKLFTDKSKETYLDKYGVNYSVEGHNKAIQTNLQKYGVASTTQVQKYKEKAKDTKFAKYGGYFNREKCKESKKRKYGDENYNNRTKARSTMLARYGVESYCLSSGCTSHLKNDSKPNRQFAEFLTKHGLTFEREFVLENRAYDFKVGSNILIEINPASTHNSTWGIKSTPAKDKYYHQQKSQLALKYGYFCIHVWDWDNWQDILYRIENIETGKIALPVKFSEPRSYWWNSCTHSFSTDEEGKTDKQVVEIYDEGEWS